MKAPLGPLHRLNSRSFDPGFGGSVADNENPSSFDNLPQIKLDPAHQALGFSCAKSDPARTTLRNENKPHKTNLHRSIQLISHPTTYQVNEFVAETPKYDEIYEKYAHT